MANFKVGDRVKRVRVVDASAPIGLIGTVVAGPEPSRIAHGEMNVTVDWDDGPKDFLAFASTLAPLTPPAEDTWAADKVREVCRPRPFSVVEPFEPVH